MSLVSGLGRFGAREEGMGADGGRAVVFIRRVAAAKPGQIQLALHALERERGTIEESRVEMGVSG